MATKVQPFTCPAATAAVLRWDLCVSPAQGQGQSEVAGVCSGKREADV